jgi:hypothetical protein
MIAFRGATFDRDILPGPISEGMKSLKKRVQTHVSRRGRVARKFTVEIGNPSQLRVALHYAAGWCEYRRCAGDDENPPANHSST